MRARRLLLTASLATLAVATAATAVGLGPLPDDALRTYAQAHVLAPETMSSTSASSAAGATPRAACAAGSLPETAAQGRVPAADYDSGRAAKGYTCNARAVGHHGQTGGFQVHRYRDRTGRECAYYDTTLLYPKDVRKGVAGTVVLDMSDPARPLQTALLATPAMQSPHESLRINHRRGLLAAAMGSPALQVGFVDLYDISGDCRQPVLRSSTPLGVLGHESGFSPDGRTFWVTTSSRGLLTALDVSNPSLPGIVWQTTEFIAHGMTFSSDGRRGYLADTKRGGLTILDVSQIQDRVPRPRARQVAFLSWPQVSVPQNSVPVTIKGRKYLVEFDEYDSNPLSYAAPSSVGAGRIIDITDERRPKVVSQLRLEVHQPAARRGEQQADPQASFGLQGYAAHYCSVPREVEPGIVACSMILSGLRVFDIRDPLRPREIAYFNKPKVTADVPLERGAYAMSAPAFAPERGEVWYSDGNTGFWNVRLDKQAWTPSGAYPAPQG